MQVLQNKFQASQDSLARSCLKIKTQRGLGMFAMSKGLSSVLQKRMQETLSTGKRGTAPAPKTHGASPETEQRRTQGTALINTAPSLRMAAPPSESAALRADRWSQLPALALLVGHGDTVGEFSLAGLCLKIHLSSELAGSDEKRDASWVCAEGV